jgi:hypothetical protein
MLSWACVPVMAWHKLSAPRFRGRFLLAFGSILALLTFSSASRADDFEERVRALAREIILLPAARRPLRLVWKNASPLSASQSESLRRAFAAELTNQHAILSEDPSAPELRVSLHETPAHLLLAAELAAAAGQTGVRFVEVPRGAIPAAGQEASFLRLQKELIFAQREKVLDAAEIPGEPGKAGLLVLGKEWLALFRPEKDGWRPQDSAPLPLPPAPPRDLRGEIRLQGQGAQIFLPGKICEAGLEKRMNLECRAGSPVWRKSVTLNSVCEAAALHLFAGDGDWTVPDHITLEAGNHNDPPASAANPLELPGPVVSLSAASDGGTAWAVVWNVTSGNYEVYRITAACGR